MEMGRCWHADEEHGSASRALGAIAPPYWECAAAA